MKISALVNRPLIRTFSRFAIAALYVRLGCISAFTVKKMHHFRDARGKSQGIYKQDKRKGPRRYDERPVSRESMLNVFHPVLTFTLVGSGPCGYPACIPQFQDFAPLRYLACNEDIFSPKGYLRSSDHHRVSRGELHGLLIK